MGAKEQVRDFLSSHPELRANVGVYNIDQDVVESINEGIEGIEIKVFTGSWCPDCRLQVPKFFSIILALDDDDFGLEILEVSRSMEDEDNLTKKLNVMAIPTFLFFRDGVELGRIIESPQGRLEEDIAGILKGSA